MGTTRVDYSVFRGMLGKMLSKIILLTLACTTSTTLALNEHEWRDRIVRISGSLTKYANQRDFVKYLEVFSDDTEVLLPGIPRVNKKDFISERFGRNGFLKEYPESHLYASFAGLLYTSPDVAIARVTEFTEFIDGSERTAFGIALFVRDGNDVRVKMAIFTME